MGSPKLWEIIGPAAGTRSLLNLATIEGFQSNNRGRRTLVVGVDISIRINAIVTALQAANAFNPGRRGQTLVLEKLFYQLCNFLLAPLTLVFVFDGPGRPPVKRGTRVIYRPMWLIQHLKTMIAAFGFHTYDAPGEAEAELAQLNKNGEIDCIITEDSDAFLFGAQCVIRTMGPSVQHSSLVFTSESIENTAAVSLYRDGLILCALLLGGDYDSGLTGAGITISQALSAAGFGKDLIDILKAFKGTDLDGRLTVWRNKLRNELRTNSSGRLPRCQPKLAESIPDTFPDIHVAELSPGFTGPKPNPNLWLPIEPSIPRLSTFCSTFFSWNGNELLKKLASNLWPGVVFRMISSCYVLRKPATNLLATPSTRARILKHFLLKKCNPAFADSVGLELYRVRASTDNLIHLASLSHLSHTAEADIKLVSIPKVILAVALRDTSLSSTDLTRIPGSVSSSSDGLEGGTGGGEVIDITDSDSDEQEEVALAIVKQDTTSNDSDGSEGDAGGVIDFDEEELANAHRTLMHERIIDLTADL
ncbi:PIN domain-like protein [Mycena leptocephala]|nr:PIN domain-like protein [Mycena leptocephala]